MTDMANDESAPVQWEYRVSPAREGWLTGVEARAAIDAWMNRPEESGAPAITVSRRSVDPQGS